MKARLTIAALCCLSATAYAQDLQKGLAAYESGELSEAAVYFYDVLSRDNVEDRRDTAEIYLADALKRLGLHVPAYFYYRDIFEAGPVNRFYVSSIAGLLDVRDALRDHLYVPVAISEHFDANAFANLDRVQTDQINYMVGELSFRQREYGEAQKLLESVSAQSIDYLKARYLLGVLSARDGDNLGAKNYFLAVQNAPKIRDNDPVADRERNLALVAAARVSYASGDYNGALDLYESVPRETDAWFTSIYESAWAYFRTGDYGRALGAVESSFSPYFAKHHVPEAYVVRATTFFVNCQWDRVRTTYATYNARYEPMRKQHGVYLGQERAPATYFRDVVADGAGRYDAVLAREVRRSQRFKDFNFAFEHMRWEVDVVARNPTWGSQRLGRDLSHIIEEQRSELENALGRYVLAQLKYAGENLENFSTQMRILDFEVTDAERQWLEQGREILKENRKRLPRPEIPSDAWQHWSKNSEIWLDEVGYYRHTIRSECLKQGEQ
ncbi:MAG: hypothetical protein H7Z43_09675 [Clostridia bacterium]|nr:hypothetical protein [Deltaproteobacteria bacterium]